MNKSPEAFRTISEVAEALDLPPHVLRFWETRFTQVKPVKRGGGRRYYRPEDVRLLRGIRGLLYDDGMTIKGVQKILRERGVRHVVGLGTTPEPDVPVAAPTAAPGAGAAPPPGKAAPAQRAGSVSASRQDDLFVDAAVPVPQPAEPDPDAEAGREPVKPPEADQETDTVTEDSPAIIPTVAAVTDAPRDGDALRALVGKLEALRAIMAEDGRS